MAPKTRALDHRNGDPVPALDVFAASAAPWRGYRGRVRRKMKATADSRPLGTRRAMRYSGEHLRMEAPPQLRPEQQAKSVAGVPRPQGMPAEGLPRARRGNAMVQAGSVPAGAAPCYGSKARRATLLRTQILLLVALAIACVPGPARGAGPEGQLTWGVHIS